MKKIIFIGNTAWGMYNFRRCIFRHFLSNGYKVVVVAPQDNIYVNKLNEIGCKFYDLYIDSKGVNPLKDVITMFKLKTILSKEKPDYCFFYTIKPNIYGSIVASLMNIPFIPITTGLGYTFIEKNIVSNIANKLYKFAFRKAPKVWFLNNDDARAFIDNNIIRIDQVQVVNGEGVDLNRFDYYPICLEEVSFILIARMLWDKGVGEYVKAAKQLRIKYPQVKFKLLGYLGVDNPSAISAQQIHSWVDEGIVEYLGSTDDVRPYIYNSTCVVLPSYREGIPFSLLEGAASFRPLIATDTSGCRDVIDDGVTGYLCKVKDVDSLVCCMERIITMPSNELIEMGKRGRMKIENQFNVSQIINKYNEIVKYEYEK